MIISFLRRLTRKRPLFLLMDYTKFVKIEAFNFKNYYILLNEFVNILYSPVLAIFR
jgi:hypothetical protein